MINLQERMLPTRRELNPQPPDHQTDMHPTEPPRLAVGENSDFFFQQMSDRKIKKKKKKKKNGVILM